MACQRQGPQSRKSVWSRSWWSIRCHRGCRMFLEHIPLGLEMSLGLNLLHGMFIKRLLLMHFLDMRLYSWPPSVLTSSVEVAIVFSPPPPPLLQQPPGRPCLFVGLLARWCQVRFCQWCCRRIFSNVRLPLIHHWKTKIVLLLSPEFSKEER